MKTNTKKVSIVSSVLLTILFIGLTITTVRAQNQYSGADNPGANPADVTGANVNGVDYGATTVVSSPTAETQSTGDINAGSQVLPPAGGSLLNISGSFNYDNGGSGKDLRYLIAVIISYLNQAMFLIVGVAVVMFVFYVVKYFIKPADGAERKEAGTYVMYSVLGFFIIISLWGIVNIVKNTFKLDSSSTSLSEFQNIFPSR
ncbi:MAG: hypothetical protein WCO48_01800 [Candidatus Taylorbacteria bacterium]